jgi:hypothetical protein
MGPNMVLKVERRRGTARCAIGRRPRLFSSPWSAAAGRCAAVAAPAAAVVATVGTLDRFGAHLGPVLGPLWAYVGTILGPFWVHPRAHVWGPNGPIWGSHVPIMSHAMVVEETLVVIPDGWYTNEKVS